MMPRLPRRPAEAPDRGHIRPGWAVAWGLALMAGAGLLAGCSSDGTRSPDPPREYGYAYWDYTCSEYYYYSDYDGYYGCGPYPYYYGYYGYRGFYGYEGYYGYYGGGVPVFVPPPNAGPPPPRPPGLPPAIANLPGRKPPPRSGNPPVPYPPVTLFPNPGEHHPPGHGGGGGDGGGGSGRGDDHLWRQGHGGLKQGGEPHKAGPAVVRGGAPPPPPANLGGHGRSAGAHTGKSGGHR